MFAINLLVSPNGDIALHFNPRFNERRVVRNTLQSQQWGMEESNEPFPSNLVPGQTFEIIILVEPNCYKIAINGQHYTQYAHRIPINYITAVGVDGDVTLTGVKFEGAGMPMAGPVPLGNPPIPAVPPYGMPPVQPPQPSHQPVSYGQPLGGYSAGMHGTGYPSTGGHGGGFYKPDKHGKHGKLKKEKKFKKQKMKKHKHGKSSSSSSSSSSSDEEE